MHTSAEFRLETPQGTIAGLRWPEPGGPRVLCLHGWLDNAASFIPMSGLLGGLDLIAVDLPGHGHSYHRHPDAHYYFTNYLFDMDAILDALGWDSCHLVGHSLGAALASLYAAAAPERVQSLVLLDTLGPIPARPEDTATRLGKSLVSVRKPPRRKKPYASVADMIKARQASSDLGDEPLRLICERSSARVESHFEWTNDPALNWVSPQLMSEDQALDCLRHIVAPTLSLTASPLTPWISEDYYRTRTLAIPHGQHQLLVGHHHFHMDQPELVAEILRSFILKHHQDLPATRK